MKRRKKNTKKESEYLAEILERICAKPQLGSHGQLSTGFPTGLLPAHSSHQEDGSFQPGFGSKRGKKKKKNRSLLRLSRTVPRSASINGTPSPLLCCHSWLQKTLQMWFLRGPDVHGDGLGLVVFFSFFLCIESAFRKLALHFLHPEVINYLYWMGKMLLKLSFNQKNAVERKIIKARETH